MCSGSISCWVPESTRLPFETALSAALENPVAANPIGPAASRSFRFCVPDEWYRRSKSRSVSSTSSDVSQDTIRRLADLEEEEEDEEDVQDEDDDEVVDEAEEKVLDEPNQEIEPSEADR